MLRQLQGSYPIEGIITSYEYYFGWAEERCEFGVAVEEKTIDYLHINKIEEILFIFENGEIKKAKTIDFILNGRRTTDEYGDCEITIPLRWLEGVNNE